LQKVVLISIFEIFVFVRNSSSSSVMSQTSPNGSELEEMQKEQSETIVSSNDNPIDPVTGLSQREKDYIQQSWSHVRQDLKAAGLGFFQAYDSALDLFILYIHKSPSSSPYCNYFKTYTICLTSSLKLSNLAVKL
jgi:hypothetical protein